MFDVPILYIIFNRLDTVKQTFPCICKQKPRQLFIAADGPRANREGEAEKCANVREWVMSQIDWDCDVHTLFRNENFGCGKNVSAAITWFFDNVEAGIVLEDDCLPTNSFFKYCEDLLERYKDNEQIMHISGTNPIIDSHLKESYWFSKIQDCWGWASWSRAWKYYNFDITDYKKVLEENRYFSPMSVKAYWRQIFSQMSEHEIDTWDYQWAFAILKNTESCCVAPTKNLVTNIGFGADSTHFSDSIDNFSFKSFEIDFPLVHPKEVMPNWKNIRKCDKANFGIDTLPIWILKQFLELIKRVLKKIGLFGFIKKIYYKLRRK